MKSSEASGIAILLIGIALLVTTFIDAYLFLTNGASIMPIHGLGAAFSQALAPLIESCIRILYLGLMGLIGSTITMRGITVLSQVGLEIEPELKLKTAMKTETESESKKAKAKAEPEPKNLEEAWEKAFQEAKVESNLEGKTTEV
jgi:type III secretory pathway component EscU